MDAALNGPEPRYWDKIRTVASTLRELEGPIIIASHVDPDGVWAEVSEAQMAEILLRSQSPQAAAEALVQAALEAGAPDNATALLVLRRV